jgi:hypothetical protein
VLTTQKHSVFQRMPTAFSVLTNLKTRLVEAEE